MYDKISDKICAISKAFAGVKFTEKPFDEICNLDKDGSILLFSRASDQGSKGIEKRFIPGSNVAKDIVRYDMKIGLLTGFVDGTSCDTEAQYYSMIAKKRKVLCDMLEGIFGILTNNTVHTAFNKQIRAEAIKLGCTEDDIKAMLLPPCKYRLQGTNEIETFVQVDEQSGVCMFVATSTFSLIFNKALSSGSASAKFYVECFKEELV